MDFQKNTTACFSGYRPEKFSFPLNMDAPQFHTLHQQVETAIKNAAQDGYITFLCGMAAGFDLVCADVLLSVREQKEFEHLRLGAIIPYSGHTVPKEWVPLYRIIVTCSDHIEFVCPTYQQNCFHERNRWMVAHSSCLICYWDGRRGGTAHTVQIANSHDHKIYNIHKNMNFQTKSSTLTVTDIL